MKKILFLLLILPLSTSAQRKGPSTRVLESWAVDASASLPRSVQTNLARNGNIPEEESGISEHVIPSTPNKEGSWLKDPITGCSVWNSAPKGNEVISWSGECQDEKASGYGVLVWFEDGKIVGRFKGTMANGKAKGRGKLEFEVVDGFAYYDGEFSDSEMHGRGVLLFPDKSRAEGEFSHDNMNGYIKATITDGGSYEGEVKNNIPYGKGLQITPEGDEYYGEFVDGKKEGIGTLLLTNGDIYKGQFKNGLADGTGTLSTVEDGIYEGQFKHGVPNGEGTFTSPNGEVARGNFVNGEPEGKIVFTLKNGKTREELWKNGKQVKL